MFQARNYPKALPHLIHWLPGRQWAIRQMKPHVAAQEVELRRLTRHRKFGLANGRNCSRAHIASGHANGFL